MGVEEGIIDGTVSNQIALRRFINREVRLILSLFESYDRRLSALLRKHLRRGMRVGSPEYKEMMTLIKELRAELMGAASSSIRKTLKGVAPVESDKEWLLLLLLLGLGEDAKKPGTVGIRDILNTPFSVSSSAASTLTDWLRNLKAADFRRVKDSVTQGIRDQATTDDIVAGAVGTQDEKFRDGQAAVTRNNIRAVVATSIIHVSTSARESLWLAMPQVVGMVWLSVLDTRTSAICRSRDNKVVMFPGHRKPSGSALLSPPGARPPAHPNCRSVMAALISTTMPSRITFDQWLRKQNKATQNEILGHAKGEMFRRGELSLDEFVDKSGKEFNLEQLRTA